jgi:hypothetical protein
VQESRQTEFRIERYGSKSFEGQNGLFTRCWDICGIFLVAGRLWRERAGARTKFGDFFGILVDFWRV